ncbi:MAG: hypothetical protein IPK82_13130 [Polyangiaceae bacterium]|nr:hypothetical protein [Polyangiaceae bacterium]
MRSSPAMRRFATCFAGVLIALAGCGGEQNWTRDSSWQGEDPSARQTSRADAYEDETHTLPPGSTTSKPDALTWFGVRHDLSMNPTAPRTPACGCLAVETGMPGKQAFLWDGQIPQIGPDALALAVSARGFPCPAEPDESKRRPSISGVERDGDNVIVEIEDLPEGRPLALGALIPKPGPNGSLFLVPRDRKMKYLPQGTNNRCKVKTPGSAPDPAAPSPAPSPAAAP